MTSCIGFLISVFGTRMCGQTLLFIVHVIANCAVEKKSAQIPVSFRPHPHGGPSAQYGDKNSPAASRDWMRNLTSTIVLPEFAIPHAWNGTVSSVDGSVRCRCQSVGVIIVFRANVDLQSCPAVRQ